MNFDFADATLRLIGARARRFSVHSDFFSSRARGGVDVAIVHTLGLPPPLSSTRPQANRNILYFVVFY